MFWWDGGILLYIYVWHCWCISLHVYQVCLHTFNADVCMPYSLAYLNQTPIFEWYVPRLHLPTTPQNGMWLKEIRPSAQILSTILKLNSQHTWEVSGFNWETDTHVLSISITKSREVHFSIWFLSMLHHKFVGELLLQHTFLA